jgi:hypothetical protein
MLNLELAISNKRTGGNLHEKNLSFLLVIVLSMQLLLACSNGSQNESSEVSETSEKLDTQEITAWLRTIIDARRI